MFGDKSELTAAGIWTAMLAELRANLWTLFAIAAPFTLLVDMVLAQFGPPQPKTMAEVTPQVALMLILVPALFGALAQLAVAHMTARPECSPRTALAAALAAWPMLVAAMLLSALPTGLGFLLLIVPGLYIAARLYLVAPIAVVERLTPVAILRRSWAMTADSAWTILWFFVLTILFLLGASLLAGGVAAALASVLTLAGLKSVGVFVAALVSALLATLFSIASAVASTVIYLKLR
ncbi:MAG: hypothetical protein H7268_00150 [Sandarakinorhabdus sp.]|nr:hypothetical protein [Sandarakinorhabdus sp.]